MGEAAKTDAWMKGFSVTVGLNDSKSFSYTNWRRDMEKLTASKEVYNMYVLNAFSLFRKAPVLNAEELHAYLSADPEFREKQVSGVDVARLMSMTEFCTKGCDMMSL